MHMLRRGQLEGGVKQGQTPAVLFYALAAQSPARQDSPRHHSKFATQPARAVKAYEDSVRIANKRYVGGLASYYEVLEAQQLLFPAENQLAQVRATRLFTYVQLYKVLGGGWHLTDAQWRGPQAQRQGP